MTIIQIFEIPRSVAFIPRSSIIKGVRDAVKKREKDETVSVVLHVCHIKRSLAQGIEIPVLIATSSSFVWNKNLEADVRGILEKEVYVIRRGSPCRDIVNSVKFSWMWMGESP